MIELAEIRRSNILLLLEKWGSKQEFAKACSLTPSQLSTIIKDENYDRVGNSIARRIEVACSMETGWLDRQHSSAGYDVSDEELAVIVKSIAATVKILASDSNYNLASIKPAKLQQIFTTAAVNCLHDGFSNKAVAKSLTS